MLTGYDIVHCLAAVVTPLPFLVEAGTPIVETLLEAPDHPACWLLPRLLPGRSVRRVAVAAATAAALDIPVVPACVDLSRFVPADVPGRHLVWDGTGGEDGAAAAAAIGARLGYPVRTVGDLGDLDPVAVLQEAVAMLHLSTDAAGRGAPWAVRALACGTPAAGWHGPLDGLADDPSCVALAPAGEWEVLADRIRSLPSRAEAGRRRREMALAHHGPTAMTARYRSIYREAPRSGLNRRHPPPVAAKPDQRLLRVGAPRCDAAAARRTIRPSVRWAGSAAQSSPSASRCAASSTCQTLRWPGRLACRSAAGIRSPIAA
jgi:hypothetical protein